MVITSAVMSPFWFFWLSLTSSVSLCLHVSCFPVKGLPVLFWRSLVLSVSVSLSKLCHLSGPSCLHLPWWPREYLLPFLYAMLLWMLPIIFFSATIFTNIKIHLIKFDKEMNCCIHSKTTNFWESLWLKAEHLLCRLDLDKSSFMKEEFPNPASFTQPPCPWSNPAAASRPLELCCGARLRFCSLATF